MAYLKAICTGLHELKSNNFDGRNTFHLLEDCIGL